MNPFDHCVSARASPGSDALYGLNTVKSVQGPLHRRPGVVSNKQGFPHYGRMRVKKLVHETNIRIGSWNIGTLNGKLMELVDIMIHRKINILCIQETKWVGEKAKEIDNLGFKLWYSGKSRTRNGVGVIIDKSLKDNVVKINRVGDRIIALKIIIDTKIVNIISAYAPQVGLDIGSKDKFWNDLEDLIQLIPLEERIFIGGDLNGHVGRVVEDFRNIHGGYGFGVTNEEGRAILDFALAYDFVITNTLFKKRDEHLITYKNGSNKTQIDYFLMRRRDRRDCKDCKVIPSEVLSTQHRLLILDFKMKSCKIKNTRIHHRRIRWGNLKDTNKIVFMSKIQDFKIWDDHEEANAMWDKVTNTIKQVAKDVLGESKEKVSINKNSWWWNNNVQEKIKYKKLCYKNWFKCKNLENWEKYQTARKEAKRSICDAKNSAFSDLYNRLDTKEGEKYMYKLAKQREKKSKDLTQVKCIKDENQKILFLEKDIQHRWVSYFDKLFNEVSENTINLSDLNIVNNNKTFHFYRRISKKEVEEALKKTKGGKSVGPDDIPIEVWKYLGDLGVAWLTKLFNIILKTKKMPEEWRKSILVPIFKNKGDAQECANYRGIKLMCHTLKLWERVIEHRLRRITKISHNQFGFMPGRSTMEAIHLLRGLMEKFRDNKEDLHLIFIDLEKAYDKVPRDILWRVLEKKGVDMTYIQVIKDMYTRAVTCVRTEGGLTKYFPISVGLHQGSALSPYLFALVMDGLTGHLQEDVPWCMLFADDILLMDKTREKVQEKLELWRSTLESKGLHLSRTKTEYMECNFSSRSPSDRSVTLGDQIIKRCERFRYLGSVVQSDGDIDGDVNSRIQVGWLKWRNASGLLCDRKVPLRLKGKFYKTVVRPAMIYGAECWPLKEKHNTKLSVAEMRMIRWMSGFTLRDKIRNDYIRDRVGVAPVTDKIRESRLRWFGHIKRRPSDDPIRRVDVLDSTYVKKGRGRPRKTWAYCIKNDLNLLDLNENMALNRMQWRKRIHVADPTLWD